MPCLISSVREDANIGLISHVKEETQVQLSYFVLPLCSHASSLEVTANTYS